jgi:hypothetical protein
MSLTVERALEVSQKRALGGGQAELPGEAEGGTKKGDWAVTSSVCRRGAHGKICR